MALSAIVFSMVPATGDTKLLNSYFGFLLLLDETLEFAFLSFGKMDGELYILVCEESLSMMCGPEPRF